MFKHTITYTDYNGVKRTEDFNFNLNQAELIEMSYGVDGGMDEYIKQIVDAKDNKNLIRIFKDLLLRSYGEKSLDGKRFVKSDAIREDFEATEAYSIMFTKLASDEKFAESFIKGIMPAQISAELKTPLAAPV